MTPQHRRIKRAEIFTRDLTAQEGRDYFCPNNDLGVIEFGETEIYKEFEVRVAKARGIMDRTFHLELGNVERATNDMTRQFETKVQIRSYSSNLESCDHCGRITETNDSYTFLEYTTDSDSDSYIEDSYVSALEQSQVKKRLTLFP